MHKKLLRTPEPHSLESYRGYLLRLAETNGLSSPLSILKLAGVSEGRMRCAEQPVEVLSSVTGHDKFTLAHLPLTNPLTNIQQVSGHPVSKGYSILTKPKICPCCIKELGYSPAFWDLIAVRGCFKHQQSLIAICTICNSNLSWTRPGLLTCECGADFSELKGSPISIEELEFLKVIHAKFEGKILEDNESSTRLPFKRLTSISLSTILAIVHSMGSMHLLVNNKVDRAKACTSNEELDYALTILKDWPNNFYKFLHRVGEKYGKNTTGLDGQFSFFTQRFFKRGYPTDEVKFLKDAFIEFGQKYWGKAFFYSNMHVKNQVTDTSDFVGVNYFAKTMGVTLTAVNTMIRDGRLASETLSSKKVNKKIIDLQKSNVKFPNKNNIIGDREAGKWIGLPVPVLKKLRDLGCYKAEHLTLNANSFCIEDLQSLKLRILDCQQPITCKDQLISLSTIMLKSYRNLGIKATIVENILNKSLVCIGSENEIPNIKVRISDLNSMVDRLLSFNRDWLTAKQTAILLSCDTGIVISMLKSGHLNGKYHNGVNEIEKESAYAFRGKYISLRHLALAFNLGVKGLITICNQNGFTLLQIKRNFNGNQTFIEKSNIEELAGHVTNYYVNHKKLAYRCRLETVNLNQLSL